jgi:hypothetical protein
MVISPAAPTHPRKHIAIPALPGASTTDDASSQQAFRQADYTFTVTSLDIFNTRSPDSDSDKVALTVAVGSGAPQTVTKDLGDLGRGHFPIGLEIGPLHVSDPDIGIAFNYLVINSGHGDHSTIDMLLTKAGGTLATKGAQAAAGAIGGLIGGSLGSYVMPIVGSILGMYAGELVGDLVGVLDANCDGPVAAEQPLFKGIDLWNLTHLAVSGSMETYHPGADSNQGCGENSQYLVTWTVKRTDRPSDAQALPGAIRPT